MPSTRVDFDHHQRILRLYVEGIAGHAVRLCSTDEAPSALQLAHVLPMWDGETLYLPAQVDCLDSARENFAVYKVAILHQLAFQQIGTLAFDWGLCCQRVAHLDRCRVDRCRVDSHGPETGTPQTAFARFFATFPRPGLARLLFTLLEDARVDAFLLRTYKGIRSDLEQIMRYSLSQRPSLLGLTPEPALLEGLVQFTLGADLPASLPTELRRALEELRRLARPVQQPTADVYVTAAATTDCYLLLQRLGCIGTLALEARDSPHTETTEAPQKRPQDENEFHAAEAATNGAEAADEPPPVAYRGAFRPDLLQKRVLLAELSRKLERLRRQGHGPSADGLGEAWVENQDVEVSAIENGEGAARGQPATDLEHAVPEHLEHQVQTLERELQEELGAGTNFDEEIYLYDEWDHALAAYRPRWCRLSEKPLAATETDSLRPAREVSARLLWEVRRQFEQLKPALLKRINRSLDGEDIDLDSAIEARIDHRVGHPMLEKVYSRRLQRERDVAAAFLIDMSASTDSEIPDPATDTGADSGAEPAAAGPKYDFTGILGDEDDWELFAAPRSTRERRRVIDVEKEAVVLMAAALETLGDSYAVFGFSGFGRQQIDFFVAKDFDEGYADEVRARIAAMKPQRSTRMGPAIRHAARKLRLQQARIKALLILSDGYPQDFDYGEDRTSREYGLQDTMMALREAQQRGIHTFCITVDPAGNDYLREMCPDHRYLVIDEVAALPRELPKVYRQLTG